MIFSKNTEKLESFIGANSKFRGDIDLKGTLRIDGSIEGNIIADWVILGEGSSVKGDISARGIVIGGRVEGSLHAKEIVEIKVKGDVQGDILTSKLQIAEGGLFEGRSKMHHEDPGKIIDLQRVEKFKQS